MIVDDRGLLDLDNALAELELDLTSQSKAAGKAAGDLRIGRAEAEARLAGELHVTLEADHAIIREARKAVRREIARRLAPERLR